MSVTGSFPQFLRPRKEANLTIINTTARFHLSGRKDHEIFPGSMLYTAQEVKQYNNLLHFKRTKAHVVQDYCEKKRIMQWP